MRKTLALLLCCFGLLFSTMALAEVPEATWETMVGQSVLLTNPQGKEIRGTLLDAQGETVRIERADGSVVTVGKAEVVTAKNLSEPKMGGGVVKEPAPAPVEPTAPEVKAVPSDSTMGGGVSKDPAPTGPAPVEPVPTEVTPVDPADLTGVNPNMAMQDAVAGEVDGRAAAQMESLTGPAAVSAGAGLASGVVCGCCGAPCAAIAPVVYGLRDTKWVEVGGSEAYNAAYNEAYDAELKKRRWIWTGVGAGAGLVVGVGVGYAITAALGNPTLIPTTVN